MNVGSRGRIRPFASRPFVPGLDRDVSQMVKAQRIVHRTESQVRNPMHGIRTDHLGGLRSVLGQVKASSFQSHVVGGKAALLDCSTCVGGGRGRSRTRAKIHCRPSATRKRFPSSMARQAMDDLDALDAARRSQSKGSIVQRASLARDSPAWHPHRPRPRTSVEPPSNARQAAGVAVS